jgi:hypothetical protein
MTEEPGIRSVVQSVPRRFGSGEVAVRGWDGMVEMKVGDFINIPVFKMHRVD